ncbi:MAG: S46 family peptidase, partial [Bacteroidota bacterium]
MKKLYVLLIAATVLFNNTVKADEGMWLLSMMEKMNYKDMQAKGLKLTPEQLYSINSSSLKDAIGWFSNGCTSELVSEKGLVFTNHHCGFGAIAALSTPQDNILDNGFWAKNLSEERPAPSVTFTLVKRIDDITSEVLDSVKGMDIKQRNQNLQRILKNIGDRVAKGTGYEATGREMFKGNAYYLFLMEKFTDVRLVGTPPQNVGKFGGETDNWMWPRHTGDFSVFRVYANKENKPSKYAADNVPYTPLKHIQVTTSGVKKGDYAMIIGFPGRTNRYEFSQGVQIATDLVDPTIVKLRDMKLNAWRDESKKSVDIRLKLVSDFASVANYWKFYRGEAEQLKNNKVFDIKAKQEAAFAKWSADKPEFKDVLTNVNKAFAAYKPFATQTTFYSECILSPYASKITNNCMSLEAAIVKGDSATIAKGSKGIEEYLTKMHYDPEIVRADKRVFDSSMLYYYNNVPADLQPQYFKDIIAKYDASNPANAIKKYTDYLYSTSIFTDKGTAIAWVKNPRLGLLQNDPMYLHIKAFKDNYNTNFKPKVDEFSAQITDLGRLYIKGLMLMNPKTKYYPDANSSIRMTYGQVQTYMNFPLI